MTNYKGDLRGDLASNNDVAIQKMSQEVMSILDSILDLEDNTDAESKALVTSMRRDVDDLNAEIRELRQQGRR